MLRCAERALEPLNYWEVSVFYKVVCVLFGYAPSTPRNALCALF